MLGTIAARAQGATLPNLSAKIMSGIPIRIPPFALQQLFVKVAEPMGEMIEVLADQNRRLRRARDLLLPRLMSGEIQQ